MSKPKENQMGIGSQGKARFMPNTNQANQCCPTPFINL